MFLRKGHGAVFNAYCIAAAFTTYFSMYAYRKPFSVGTYAGSFELPFLPAIDYKIAFLIAQLIGYTLSKFLGIKLVSEAQKNRRALFILASLGVSELALLAFAVVPNPLRVFFIFLNGIPLGLIWGLVFSFLEGRRSTELLGAGLSTSYILASGAVKTVGKMVFDLGVSELWMPFVTGLLFVPVTLLSVKMLSMIPPPTAEDERLRTKRVPMDREARRRFFQEFAPGLICLTVFYMFLTAYRDFRDNFAREIWDALGRGDEALIFTSSEIPIAVIVLGVLAAIMYVRRNDVAVALIHVLLVGGSALIGLSTLAFQMGWISPLVWMISVGLGLYLGYVPFGCILFDRIIAATGFLGTASFMIYLTDSFGYLGSVFVLFYKNFGHPNISWLDFFISISYVTSIACTLGFVGSMFYFQREAKGNRGTAPVLEAVPKTT